MHRRLLCTLAFAATTLAHANGWDPTGPADGRLGSIPIVATHPTAGGQLMISAGFVPGDGRAATFFSGDGGEHWSSNARFASGGPIFLSGTPTIALQGGPSGVLRSTDTGRTWAPVSQPAIPPNTSFNLHAVNPTNPQELVASAGSSLFHTLDGGATWTTDTAPASINVAEVDWSTRTLYASFAGNSSLGHHPLDAPGDWGVGGSDVAAFGAGHGFVIYRSSAGALFRSTDGGIVFSPVGQALGPVSVCDFAFAAASSLRVYAIECDQGRVLRSDDDGASWANTGTITDPMIGGPAVDAVNYSRLYVMTTHGPLQSFDGGTTFVTLDRPAGAPGDLRALYFDPVTPARQWLTRVQSGPASILRSDNAGASWSEIDTSHRLLGASRSRTNTLFGTISSGLASDNTLALSTDGGVTWTEKVPYFGARGAVMGPLAYGQGNGEIFVAAASFNLGNIVESSIFYSNDDGDSFTERFSPLIRVNALAATPTGAMAVYLGGEPISAGAPQLYRSTNAAVTWQPVATFPAALSSFGGTNGNTITALAIDPSDPARLYVGFAYPDYVMRSDDAGATWVRATNGLGAGSITSLVIDPAVPSTIYASMNGSGVFRSADRGVTWAAMDDGLHDEIALGLKRDPHVAGRLYVETGSGLYRTDLASGIPAGDRRAIEFYHQGMNHYFVSADLDEIAGLDAGVFQGWARTGEGFRVAEATTSGNQAVCRFFTVSGFQSTHFYTPYANECDLLKADPAWTYEKIAFGLALPDAQSGGCPPGSRALRRMWNANQGGMPNHRYSTSVNTLQTMSDLGWIFEGNGDTLVFACVPY